MSPCSGLVSEYPPPYEPSARSPDSRLVRGPRLAARSVEPGSSAPSFLFCPVESCNPHVAEACPSPSSSESCSPLVAEVCSSLLSSESFASVSSVHPVSPLSSSRGHGRSGVVALVARARSGGHGVCLPGSAGRNDSSGHRFGRMVCAHGLPQSTSIYTPYGLGSVDYCNSRDDDAGVLDASCKVNGVGRANGTNDLIWGAYKDCEIQGPWHSAGDIYDIQSPRPAFQSPWPANCEMYDASLGGKGTGSFAPTRSGESGGDVDIGGRSPPGPRLPAMVEPRDVVQIEPRSVTYE